MPVISKCFLEGCDSHIEEKKTCLKCYVHKCITRFVRSYKNASGYRGYCLDCKNKERNARYPKNKCLKCFKKFKPTVGGRYKFCSDICKFMDKVSSKGMNECWIWKGNVRGGYGTIFLRSFKKTFRAHRASWLLHFKDLPQDKMVLHKCDKPKCVNPNHLFLGTNQDNMDDMRKKGRGVKRCKLNPKQVIEIKKLVETGLSRRKIAESFMISPSAINDIANGLRWKFVEYMLEGGINGRNL